MASTYELINSYTVGSGGASGITFSSIPQTYTDLVVFFSARSDNANNDAKINFNSVTTGYSRKTIQNNSSWSGNDAYIGDVNPSSYTANTFINCYIYIPNYTSSNYKSYSFDNVQENNGAAVLFLGAGLWSNTAAITQLALLPISSFNFVQYSTAYLYGVKNA